MKKKAFVFIMFVFVAVLCGNFSFFNKFNVYALNISNARVSNEIVQDDRFETITLSKNLTEQDLISAISKDLDKKDFLKNEQSSEEVSVGLANSTELTEDEIVAFCEDNDYVVMPTNYGYEIYYKFQLKTLIVDRSFSGVESATKITECGENLIVEFETEEETKDAYDLLRSQNHEVFADMIATTAAIDNFSTGNFNSWGADAIDIDTYQNYYKTNGSTKEVVVAVVDTGINTSHELFEGRLLKSGDKIVGYCDDDITTKYTYSGYSFEDDNTHGKNSSGSLVETYTGHGSHVSGTICELTPTNVKILPMKVFNYYGSCSFGDIFEALQALIDTYSKTYNVVAVNLSLGGAFASTSSAADYNNEFDTYFNNLRAKNILPVVAAGNDKKDTSYISPGGCGDSAVVVSALKESGTSYVFDNSYSNYGNSVDISAPGTFIKSATIGQTNAKHTGEYKYLQGTSMATPHVAAAAALLYLDGKYYDGDNVTYTASDIEQRLFKSAVDLGTSGKDVYYGYGMLNLKNFNGNISYSVLNKTYTYDGGYHNISVTVSGVSGATVSYGLTPSSCNITNITTNEAFKNYTNGEKTIYFKISATNYIDTYGSGKLTINQADVTIKTNNQTSVYGDVIQLDQDEYSKTSGKVYGTDDLGIVLSTNATNTSPVAEYDITATATNQNYNITVQKGKLEITKRPIDITLQDQKFTYGEEIDLDTSENSYKVTSTKNVVNGDKLNLELYTAANSESVVNGDYTIEFVSANANYDVMPTSGKLIITPRSIKIKCIQSAYYGDEVKLQGTYTVEEGSLVNGDSLNLTVSTTATEKSSVDWYPITATSSNPNYSVKMVDSYYKIYQRLISIQPSPQTFVYGEEIVLDQTKYTIENIVNNDFIEVELYTDVDSTTDVGNDYLICSKYVSSTVTNNYTINCESTNLTITQRPITIKANNQTSMYGDDVKLDTSSTAYDVTSTKKIVNEDEIVVSFSTQADCTSVVGNYPIEISASGKDVDNYSITLENGNLEITKRQIEIDVLDQDSVYGKEIVLTANYKVISEKGIVNNDDLKISLHTDATSASPIGEYDITLSYDNANYQVTSYNGKLYIKGREVIIVILPQESVYGETVKLNQTLYEISEEDKSLPITLHTEVDNKSSVGEYDITATTSDNNVKLSYENGVYSITPRDLIITTHDQSCTYGEINLQSKYVLGETINGDVVEVELNTDATNESPVGDDYKIFASTTNKNYNLVVSAGTLTIAPKELTITMENQECFYGEISLDQTKYKLSQQPYNNDELNIKLKTDATDISNVAKYDIVFEFVNENYNITGEKAKLTVKPRPIIISIYQKSVYGEDVSLDPYDYEVTSHNQIINNDELNLQLSTLATGQSGLGVYDVTVVCGNANYTIMTTSAKVEIVKREITISVDNQTRIYGDTINEDEFTFTIPENAIVNGDQIDFSPSTIATNESPVKEYFIDLSWQGEDATNYTILVQKGILTIEKRKVTLEIANQNSMYGAPIQLEKLYQVVSERGIVNNDDLNIEMKTSATEDSPVGCYPIYLTWDNANYDVTSIEGVLTIVEGDTVVTILPQTFVYGEEINVNKPNVKLIEIIGDVDPEELCVTLKTDVKQFDDVGDNYEIDLDWTNKNYNLIIKKGVLTITPHPISITLKDQNRVYGDVQLDDAEIVINSQIFNGDSLGLSLYSNATNTSLANQNFEILYTWTNKNYQVTATNSARVYITQRELEIKALHSGVYGNAVDLNNINYSVVVGSVVNNDDLAIKFSTNANKFSPVGKYAITISQSNSNYNISFSEDSKYEVVARSITISTDQMKYYGDETELSNKNYLIISGGVVNNDDLSLKFSTTATKESPVGEYDINLDSCNTNYNVILQTGTLHVYKRVLFVETIQSGEYGNYFALNNSYTIVQGSMAFETDELNVRFSTDATISSSVGNYKILMKYDNVNYDVQLQSTSHFKVLPRTLKIEIENQSSVYGEKVELDQTAYKITNGSIVNSDQVTITLSTIANEVTNVGEYAISGTANNANYNVVFENGKYTVAKRKIVVKINDQKTARGITFEIEQGAYQIIDGEIVDGDELNIELYSKAKMFSMIGNYVLKAKYSNENYEVVFVEGNLFVNISFIDVALIIVFVGVITLIVIKVVKKKKAKQENQKLFDKWIKW